jgi:actin-related protein
VIDFGAQSTRMVPIVDGHVLNTAVVSTTKAGNWLDSEVQKEINSQGMKLRPWFETDGKHCPIK